MNAGLLKEQITLKEEVNSINKYGEHSKTYRIKYVCRARVINDSGSRVIDNNEIVYDYHKTFQVRSYVPVVETDIIVWDLHEYRILTIEHRKDVNDIIIKAEQINE